MVRDCISLIYQHEGELVLIIYEFLVEGELMMAVCLPEVALDGIAVGGFFEMALGCAKSRLGRIKHRQLGL